MTKLNEIYKCEVCGNIVEVLHAGAGELVCCGQPMKLREANTVDAANEKHVPVVEIADGKIVVKVGSEPHPMEDSHFIEWIEVLENGEPIARARLKPGDKPEATFCLCKTEDITAREYCNLHGLWRS